jgi:uncharacterized membrane protein YccC
MPDEMPDADPVAEACEAIRDQLERNGEFLKRIHQLRLGAVVQEMRDLEQGRFQYMRQRDEEMAAILREILALLHTLRRQPKE